MRYAVIVFFSLFLLIVYICGRQLLESDSVPAGSHINGGDGDLSWGVLPDIAPTAGTGAAGRDGLTVLLNGEESADPAFRPGGSQPAVAVRLTEPGGQVAFVLIDIGDSSDAFLHNLGQWGEQQNLASLPENDRFKKALYVSHVHSYQALFALLENQARKSIESLSGAWEHFGHITVQGPNLDFFCALRLGHDLSGVIRELCDGLTRSMEPGLEPVRFSDGTRSKRAWTLTYPIVVPEQKLPFDPYETIFVFRHAGGYIVYSVCSHPLAPQENHGSQRPFHAVELVRRSIDDGQLPPGPIHTLITGACGMERLVGQIVGDRASSEQLQRTWRDKLERHINPTVTERVYLSHCGLLRRWHQSSLVDVFHGDVQRALPGSFIPF